MNLHQAIDKTRSVIRRQHKALSTEETYVFWLRRYIRAVQKMPRDLTSERKLDRCTLCIRGAKGGNDRVVALPASLLPEIKQQREFAREVWQRDRQNRTPLMLPHRLARKYPEYQFAWGWAWLFPAHCPCRDPRTECEPSPAGHRFV